MFENIKNKIDTIMQDNGLVTTEAEFNFENLPATNLDNIYLLRIDNIATNNYEASLINVRFIIYMSFGFYNNNIFEYEDIIDKLIDITKRIDTEIFNSADITINNIDKKNGNFLQPQILFNVNFI